MTTLTLRPLILAYLLTIADLGRALALCARRTSPCWRFFRPDAEPRQGTGAKVVGERHIGGVTAVRHEDTPYPRGVVARVERVPPTAEIDFDPRRKIHGRVRRGKADIGNVTGAVACRDPNSEPLVYFVK
jgi:hypothetical protein